MPREVARFIQSRFGGGLKVSGARYEDPLAEADECYPRMVEALNPYRLEETSPLLACAKLHKQSKRQKA